MDILEINPINISVEGKSIITDGRFSVSSGDVVLLTGPNGCGKSTLIKAIMGDTFDYSHLNCENSSLMYHLNGQKMDLFINSSNRDVFRRNVCYVSQDDEFESPKLIDVFLMSLNFYDIDRKEQYIFDFIKRFSIYKGFGITEDDSPLDSRANSIKRKIRLKTSKLTPEDRASLKLLTLDIRKMSGGQKKLANIVTNLVRYKYTNLIILDEPLNNLDYNNVRVFSNLLTMVYREKPELGIIIVTHCRSIPIINKVVEIDPRSKHLVLSEDYKCSSCFGSINSECLYV